MNAVLDKLKTLEPRQLKMLLLGGLVFIVVVDILFLLVPQLNGVLSLGKKSAQLKSDIQTLSSTKQRMAQLESGRQDVRNQISDLNKMVHKKDEVHLVMKSIFTLANKYGIKIDRVAPQPRTMQVIVKNEYGTYSSMTVFVDLYSDLRRFGNFLRRLEQDKIFWKIDDFVLSADDTNPQRQKFTVNLKIIIAE